MKKYLEWRNRVRLPGPQSSHSTNQRIAGGRTGESSRAKVKKAPDAVAPAPKRAATRLAARGSHVIRQTKSYNMQGILPINTVEKDNPSDLFIFGSSEVPTPIAANLTTFHFSEIPTSMATKIETLVAQIVPQNTKTSRSHSRPNA